MPAKHNIDTANKENSRYFLCDKAVLLYNLFRTHLCLCTVGSNASLSVCPMDICDILAPLWELYTMVHKVM